MGCAAHPEDPANAGARACFADGVRTAKNAGLTPTVVHLAATAAALTDPLSHFAVCRVGAGLVGIDPSHTTRLHPAMTLRAPLVAVREVDAGTAVGYDRGYVADRGSIGGAISMDQIVVDLTEACVEMGDLVTLFGPGGHGEPTLQDWAGWAETIEHEIVTGIGSRVARVVVSDVKEC